MSPKPDRINLEISPTAKQRIRRLPGITDAHSLSEIVRRAVATYDTLVQERSRGGRVVVLLEDGSEKELLLT